LFRNPNVITASGLKVGVGFEFTLVGANVEFGSAALRVAGTRSDAIFEGTNVLRMIAQVWVCVITEQLPWFPVRPVLSCQNSNTATTGQCFSYAR
jgi:hypothetical protein